MYTATWQQWRGLAVDLVPHAKKRLLHIAGLQGEAAPPPCMRLAKWGDPAGDVVVPFQITEGPILLE